MLTFGLTLPGAAQAAYPGAIGKIAWEGFPGGGGTDSEIVVSNADGTGITPLTINSVNDIDPAWSPDGRKIAFARFNGTYYEIWTMNADGSGQTAVVQLGKSTTHPTWSPAGNKLLFTYAFSASDDDIYAADSTGLNSNTAAFVQAAVNERDPAWEPGGSRIAFTQFNSGSGRYDIVFKAYPSGAIAPFLFSAVTDFSEPAWSADGTKLAFRNGLSGTNDDIFTEKLDGTGYGYKRLPASIGVHGPEHEPPEARVEARERDLRAVRRPRRVLVVDRVGRQLRHGGAVVVRAHDLGVCAAVVGHPRDLAVGAGVGGLGSRGQRQSKRYQPDKDPKPTSMPAHHLHKLTPP